MNGRTEDDREGAADFIQMVSAAEEVENYADSAIAAAVRLSKKGKQAAAIPLLRTALWFGDLAETTRQQAADRFMTRSFTHGGRPKGV